MVTGMTLIRSSKPKDKYQGRYKAFLIKKPKLSFKKKSKVNSTLAKDSHAMISYMLFSHFEALGPIIREIYKAFPVSSFV